MTVIELGAGEDPDPRADITVDRVPLEGIDIVHNLEETPWPVETASADRVIAHHVLEHLADPKTAFQEAARILQADGILEVYVPIGLDAKTDPTHQHEWTWDTPEYFTQDTPYDYGWNLPFHLVNREVEYWLDGPLGRFSPIVSLLVAYSGPGKWLSGIPALSGILTAQYQRHQR